MIRYNLFIILAVLCFLGSSLCSADELIPDKIPSSEAHAQIVNQALDQVEYNPSTQVVAPAVFIPKSIESIGNNQIPGYPSAMYPRKNDFVLKSEMYWSKYDEPQKMYQKGFMSGFNAQFTHRIYSAPELLFNMVSLQGLWAGGKFKTEPVDQGPSGIKDSTYDIRALIGKDFHPASDVRVTGYSGFGYRYLKDNSEGLNTISGDFISQGYARYSHYCYLPLGADIVYQNNRRYSIEGNIEYDYMMHGWQVSKLGVVPGYSTLVVDQKDGGGLRLSLRLNLNYKYCTAFAEWFYRYWDIAASKSKPDPTDPTSILNEPRNNTEEFGMRFGLEI